MNDYGLLVALRSHLCANETVQRIFDKRVYLNLPAKPVYPCLHLHVNDITHTGDSCGVLCCINFQISVLTLSPLPVLPSHMDHALATLLDGHVVTLPQDCRANFQKGTTVIDLPTLKTTRVFMQAYKGIVWKINLPK